MQWFASRGPGELVDQIRIPTLLIQGTADTLFTLDEAITNYAILRANKVPTKMIWFCGGHGACLTDAGDTGRIERETWPGSRATCTGDRRVDTGPRFEWIDQDGRCPARADYRTLPDSTPSIADGNGTLPLVNGGGSGPGVVPAATAGEIGVPSGAASPRRRGNAVSVSIPAATATLRDAAAAG